MYSYELYITTSRDFHHLNSKHRMLGGFIGGLREAIIKDPRYNSEGGLFI